MKSGLKGRERANMEFYYAFSLRPRGGEWDDDECGGDNLEFRKRGRIKVENNNVEEKRMIMTKREKQPEMDFSCNAVAWMMYVYVTYCVNLRVKLKSQKERTGKKMKMECLVRKQCWLTDRSSLVVEM